MKVGRYVPLEKRSKKQRREHFAAQRNDWNGVKPVTRVLPDKRKPCRRDMKQQLDEMRE